MPEPKNEFTKATSLDAEAIGEPGDRTFRILVNSGSSSLTLWLEKEQLFELALAIQRLLATLPEKEGSPGEPPYDREAPDLTQLDFKVGQLTLGHHAGSGHFHVDAHDVEDEEDSPATVRVWANKSQVEEFAKEALHVCSAGRPICPLCGGPIDSTGHFCPRVNGHRAGLES